MSGSGNYGDDIESRARSQCHSKACAIQDCLQKRGYDQQKCQSIIDAYNKCVADAKKQLGDNTDKSKSSSS
jgi:hypothetical protein